MSQLTAITIGNFDGVHLGHAALVSRARDHAGPGGRVLALAFDPHPLTRVAPAAAPARLTSFVARSAMLTQLGADEVLRLDPSDEVLSMEPDTFIRWVVSTYRPHVLVEGADFHFGKNRSGTVDTLRQLGAATGFVVDVVDAVEVALSDHTIVRASSTMVRWLLSRGRVGDAANLLGSHYQVHGTVERGDQRGRTIGFPTANLHQPADSLLLPADGVYACLARLPDGRELPAAVNIGTRPTVQGLDRRIEAHLIESSTGRGAEVPPTYGWSLSLAFFAFVRDQVRFADLDALGQQLERDRRRVLDVIESDAACSASSREATR